MQDGAMTGHNGVHIELRKALQSLRPFAWVAIKRIGDWVGHQVACNDNLFLGKINNGIAGSVATPQELDLDHAISDINVEVVIEGQRGTLELELLEFLLNGEPLGNDTLQLCFFLLRQISG